MRRSYHARMTLRDLGREAAARLIRWSGLPRAVRYAARGRVTIAFYHDPTPQVMDAHLRYLRARYAFITLDALVDALRARDWSRLPERALVLTFDDGHRGNHALLPVFRSHGVRPTIYLCSGIVGTDRRFWFLERGPIEAWKRLRNADRLAALRDATGFEQERGYPDGPRQALSREEIAEMAPHVDFGSHTRFHPVLTQCDDAEAWDEIAASKRELEALLGRPCRHFSYPNGDYTQRDAALAERAGYDSARSIDQGANGASSDRFALRVVAIADDASVDMLAAQLSGIAVYLRRLVQGRLDARKPTILASERAPADAR
jgi:peptidoglycan/xylan/chitin deacetylase (PgdA/CDA1 family)